jgi:hypothetical protein
VEFTEGSNGLLDKMFPKKWNAASIMSILCKNHDTLMKMQQAYAAGVVEPLLSG